MPSALAKISADNLADNKTVYFSVHKRPLFPKKTTFYSTKCHFNNGGKVCKITFFTQFFLELKGLIN